MCCFEFHLQDIGVSEMKRPFELRVAQAILTYARQDPFSKDTHARSQLSEPQAVNPVRTPDACPGISACEHDPSLPNTLTGWEV